MQRKKFIEHIGWTGLGIVWSMGSNGLMTACQNAGSSDRKSSSSAALSFVQISDSHIGFNKAANEHPIDTLEKAIKSINALPNSPAFVVHTGDITQLSKPAEFDMAKQVLTQLKAPMFTIPGEHDTIGDRGKAYSEAFPAQKRDRDCKLGIGRGYILSPSLTCWILGWMVRGKLDRRSWISSNKI